MLRLLLLTAASVVLLLNGGERTHASDSQADLDAYCKAVHGDSAFKTIDRRDNGFLCTVGMDPGPGMIHHKMQPSDACAVQFGTRSFRREGEAIICTNVSEGGAGQGSEKIDLAEYCASQHGTEAEVTRNNVTGAPMCTVRTDGGLGLRHHVVDVASLCPAGTSPGPVTGTELNCIGESKTAATEQSGQPTGSGGQGAAGEADPEIRTDTDAGAPYSGEVVTGETWRGIEGEASFFSGLDLRIERAGTEFKAFIAARHKQRCGDRKIPVDGFSPEMNCQSEGQGIIAEKLVLVGTVGNGAISGKTRLTMTFVPLPFPVCDAKWAQLDDNPSAWIDFRGQISGDKARLELDPNQPRAFLPDPKPGKIGCTVKPFITKDQWDGTPAPAAIMKDLPGNTKGLPPLEFVNSIRFQRLNEGPSVLEIRIVDADPPFADVDTVSQGQRLRLKVLVDRPATGHKVPTTARSDRGELKLTATCGSELVSDPTVCMTPIFKTTITD